MVKLYTYLEYRFSIRNHDEKTRFRWVAARNVPLLKTLKQGFSVCDRSNLTDIQSDDNAFAILKSPALAFAERLVEKLTVGVASRREGIAYGGHSGVVTCTS